MPPKKKTKAKKPAAKIVKATKKKEPIDPNIEEIFYEEVTFMCPKRGLVKQKVKIKKYRSKIIDVVNIVGTENSSDLIDKIEKGDNGLSIYSEDIGKDD